MTKIITSLPIHLDPFSALRPARLTTFPHPLPGWLSLGSANGRQGEGSEPKKGERG